MTRDADEFNAGQIAGGIFTVQHITELVEHWQRTHPGLTVDGKAGAGQTIPSIVASIAARTPVAISVQGDWLVGPDVTRIPAHDSWFGSFMTSGRPLAIVVHYTTTNPGTAINMAKTRNQPYRSELKPEISSWHITIDTDGSVVIMIPLNRKAWHAGSKSAKPIPGVGNANYNSIGIELVGVGKQFPPAQVNAAKIVWRALVKHYGIERQHAMVTHQSIDPTQRTDPGPVWVGQHAQHVLDFAYAP